jgi:hypothetical protein
VKKVEDFQGILHGNPQKAGLFGVIVLVNKL